MDVALFFAGFPNLWLALFDAMHNGICNRVDFGRHAVRLIEDGDCAVKVQKTIDVGPCPVVDGLVIIPG